MPAWARLRSWTPPISLGPWPTLVLQLSVIIVALSRAMDYLTGDSASPEALHIVVAAGGGSLAAWGYTLLVGCLLVLVGLSVPRLLIVTAFGHWVLVGVYLAIGWGQMSAVVRIAGADLTRWWLPILVGATMFHLMYAIQCQRTWSTGRLVDARQNLGCRR